MKRNLCSTNERRQRDAWQSLTERIPAFIPITYVSDPSLRIQAYRDVAEITTHEQLQRLGHDWRDRFGPFPAAVDNLLGLIEIKLAAAKIRDQPGRGA